MSVCVAKADCRGICCIMGNTSDRLSGDRHGAKPQRSDSGGHKDLEPGKMMDSTDDPNIFNTHGPEAKV